MIILNFVSIFIVLVIGSGEYHIDSYSVDGLDIDVSFTSVNCVSGYEYSYFVDGEINSDLLFVLTKLLAREQHCIAKNPELNVRTKVFLDSSGGFTKDAYGIGRLFRIHEVKTFINNDVACSSACAIAFLGGTERYIFEHGIINFHQPYTIDSYIDNKPIITCSEDTTLLLQYFIEMTNDATGTILHNRSLLYCGVDSYWQIYGTNAALLYGIANT